MKNTQNGQLDDLSATPPSKVQNADSLGKQSEKKFKYQNEGFVDEVRNYLQPGSKTAKTKVGAGICKHFYRHAEEMLEIRDLLGVPPPKGERMESKVSTGQWSAILEIIRVSNHPKPLKFFVSELWGLNFSKARVEVKSTGGNESFDGNRGSDGNDLTITDGNVELVESEIFYDGREAVTQLREILTDSATEQRAMSESELISFTSVFAESTKVAIDQTRQYLETMLLIGAGMIFMRFQRRLLDKAEYSAFDAKIRAVLKDRFRSVSEDALKSTLGRISRAYRHAMSVHLDVEDPKLGDYEKLWDFYKKSLREIPALVDRYIEGGFDYKDLIGIPFLPSIGDKEEKEPKPPSEKPEWHKYLKLLRPLFKAAEEGYLEEFIKKRSKEIGVTVEATLFTLEHIKEFYVSVDSCGITAHTGEIKKEVQEMHEVVQRITS